MPAAAVASDVGFVMAIGIVAGLLTTGCLIPQVVRTYKTRSTRDFSLIYLTAMDAGIVLWILYGVFLLSFPVIIANGVSAVLVTYLLACKVRDIRKGSLVEAASEHESALRSSS